MLDDFVVANAERALILEKDPEVMEQYLLLVLKERIITEDEFFALREAELERFSLEATAPKALNLVETTVSTKKLESIKYEITKDMIIRIFMEQPLVRQRYVEKVPHEMSAIEFWTAYAHSKYLASERKRRKKALKESFLQGKAENGQVRSATAVDDDDNLDTDDEIIAVAKAVSNSKAAKDAQAEQAAENTMIRSERHKKREYREKGKRIFGDSEMFELTEGLSYSARVGHLHEMSGMKIDPSIDLRSTLNDTSTFSSVPGLTDDRGYGLAVRDPLTKERDEIATKVLSNIQANLSRGGDHRSNDDDDVDSAEVGDRKPSKKRSKLTLSKREELIVRDVATRQGDPLLSKKNLEGALAVHTQLPQPLPIYEEDSNNGKYLVIRGNDEHMFLSSNHARNSTNMQVDGYHDDDDDDDDTSPMERLKDEEDTSLHPDLELKQTKEQIIPLNVSNYANDDSEYVDDAIPKSLMEMIERKVLSSSSSLSKKEIIPNEKISISIHEEQISMLDEKRKLDENTANFDKSNAKLKAWLEAQLRAAIELCRHYFATFQPPITPLEREKRQFIRSKIERFLGQLNNNYQSLREKQASQANLILPIIRQLEKALQS